MSEQSDRKERRDMSEQNDRKERREQSEQSDRKDERTWQQTLAEQGTAALQLLATSRLQPDPLPSVLQGIVPPGTPRDLVFLLQRIATLITTIDHDGLRLLNWIKSAPGRDLVLSLVASSASVEFRPCISLPKEVIINSFCGLYAEKFDQLAVDFYTLFIRGGYDSD